MAIRTEDVEIAVPGETRPMPAYLAVPDGGGPLPAVLVIEEIFGVNAHIRDVTDRVAKEGYVAIAPDIHHRAAPGQQLEYDDAGRKAGMALIAKLTTDGILADLNATIAFLRARSDVRGDRIGCMGFCIGGHIAYLAACETDVRATASFYGGGIATFGPGGQPPTVTRTAKIRGRILCLFGKNDSMITQTQIETIQQALVQGDVRHEVVVYDNAGHGFFRDVHSAYVPAAARDAWERVKALFAEELAAG
jgi:carboxymethylenebutenolidase